MLAIHACQLVVSQCCFCSELSCSCLLSELVRRCFCSGLSCSCLLSELVRRCLFSGLACRCRSVNWLVTLCFLCRCRLGAAPVCFIVDDQFPAGARVGLIVIGCHLFVMGFRWPVLLVGLSGLPFYVFSPVVYEARMLAARARAVAQ